MTLLTKGLTVLDHDDGGLHPVQQFLLSGAAGGMTGWDEIKHLVVLSLWMGHVLTNVTAASKPSPKVIEKKAEE